MAFGLSEKQASLKNFTAFFLTLESVDASFDVSAIKIWVLNYSNDDTSSNNFMNEKEVLRLML